MIIDDWRGCYNNGWQGEIVPAAFAHPAKYSRALIRRIYEHCKDENWLRPWDLVLDPFGGVALGGLDAMRLGLRWIGIELEQKFVDLGNQNIALWNQRYGGKLPMWGAAQLVQGDSRNLLAIIGGASAVISSPPYSHPARGIDSDEMDKKQHIINEMRLRRGNIKGGIGISGRMGASILAPNGYGTTPGNLGNLRATDAGLQAALSVSSPPYIGAQAHPSIGSVSKDEWGTAGKDIVARRNLSADYGSTPGQLGQMREGDFAAAVASPPYEASINADRNGIDWTREKLDYPGRVVHEARIEMHNRHANSLHYADRTDGQLGASSGDDFWHAARAIVSQTYAALCPGSHTVWVVKAFIRNKAIVDFPGQWRQLCESCGFMTLHEHHASLIVDNGMQLAIDGNHKSKRIKRASFFRRLAESKGSPVIDFEVVLCQEKPTGANL